MDCIGVLVCPACGGDYLHQEKVEVGFRRVEDETLSSVAITSRLGTSLHGLTVPGRRDAIRIYFDCENCARSLRMLIKQHKGQTLIEWEPIDG